MLHRFLIRPSILVFVCMATGFMVGCGGGGGTAAPVAVTVQVSPGTTDVNMGALVQYAATGGGNSYIWSVNGVGGGDAAHGTITGTGLYQAPVVPPTPDTVTITARSITHPEASGSASARVLLDPLAATGSVTPPTILTGTGDMVITVNGSSFVPGSTVNLATHTLATTFVSANQLTAVVPATLLAAPAAYIVTVPNNASTAGLDFVAVLTVLASGTVTATNHPQVAKYSITLPRSGQVTVEFGSDTSYGRRTWSRPTPTGGGGIDVLVAGMKAFSSFHMRAIVEFPEGTQFVDKDHTFTTGGLPPERVPQLTVTRPSGLPNNNGVELLDLIGGSKNQVLAAVTDLDGNLIWYYDYDSAGLGIPFPWKPLSNGNLLLILTGPGPQGLGTGGILREIDLAGNTIRELSKDDLNQHLAAAGFNLSVASMTHDVVPLPNGHFVVLAYSVQSFTDLPGFPGQTDVAGDALVDLDANWNPVWVWNAFDHLDVNRHPLSFPDWTHGNAVIYSPDDGNLLLSMRHQHWVIKIDYQDGLGSGNILWRLGYQGDFTMQSGGPEAWQYGQHFPVITSPNTTGVFDLLLFDNGTNRVLDTQGTICGTTGNPPCYSRAPIFRVDEVSRNVQVLSDGRLPLYSLALGSVVLFDDGNVEADMGILFPTSARVVEMTQEAVPQIVWQMDLNDQWAYRMYRIPSLYPGVQW